MEARAPSRIRALIYDFDDTLVESERINDQLFSEFLRREHNIDLSREELDYLYGFSWTGYSNGLQSIGACALPEGRSGASSSR